MSADRKEAFREDLRALLNRYSMESEGGNTPDFALADYLIQCLYALDKAIKDGKDMRMFADNHADFTPWHVPETPDERLAKDRRLYGSSWERVDADGSRHRIDPVTVAITPPPQS